MQSVSEPEFWGAVLARWPESVVAQQHLTAEDGAYLTTVGLPVGVDWTLQVEIPSPSEAVEQVRGTLVLAHDGDVPICLEPTRREVRAIEGARDRFVNSNLPAFGAFLVIYQQYRQQVRQLSDEAEIERLIANVEARMKDRDPRAMADNEAYWPVVVEQMRAGLL